MTNEPSSSVSPIRTMSPAVPISNSHPNPGDLNIELCDTVEGCVTPTDSVQLHDADLSDADASNEDSADAPADVAAPANNFLGN